MRLGIMTMQKEALIPADMSADLALAYLADFDHARLVRELHSHGFDPVELGGDMPLLLPNTLDQATIARLALLREELGVTYTVHLPLWSVELSTPLAPVRAGSIRATVDTIRATIPLLPEIYVLHATGALAAEFYRMDLPDLARNFILRQFQAHAHQSIVAILNETGIASRQLAVETVEFPFDLTVELADELDLSVCLDTGHILVGFSGPINLDEALLRCMPRLAEIHLHDGPWQGPEHRIGYGRDHQALGAGDLDLGMMFDQLEDAGFTGPIILELTLAQALSSLDVIRNARPGMI